ncbi:hypothetical protein [Pigmentiphaga daeguensis]|uniref:Uncharacterized protein n=1 Tax=Pigmentiphaga daeguensis TaxID=414049 RepID=A0ABN1BAS4_9BURK
MAIQEIDLSTPQVGGGVGDPARVAFEKVNANFSLLAAQYEALKALVEAGGGGAGGALYWQDDETGELIVDDDNTQIEGL